MRTFLVAFMAAACLLVIPARARTIPTIPSGDVFEVHSCELYTGGCLMSSEAPSEGRYLVRLWNFSGGTCNGTGLRGLQVAVLQVADDNLAEQRTHPAKSVVYLPARATQGQRDALLAWLKSEQPDSVRNLTTTRAAPMSFTKSGSTASFSVGDFLRVSVRPMQACDRGGCGESLWYTPRTSTTSFTVSMIREAFVDEPALALKWTDHGKPDVFSGTFGETQSVASNRSGLSQVCDGTVSLRDVNR